MVKVKIYGNGTSLKTVALCDEASTVTIIDDTIAEMLDLPETRENLCL